MNNKANTKNQSKDNQNTNVLIICIALIVIIAIVIALLFTRKKLKAPSDVDVVSRNELIEKLDVDINEPENAKDIIYGIENENIAVLKYNKIVDSGEEMNFILRSSYSVEDIENSIGLDVEFAYTPIMMTVICEDSSEIPVEAKVAVDEEEEMKYMKALWFDNDKYYSMVTDNLVTREDFLQEVNRVIISNHIPF